MPIIPRINIPKAIGSHIGININIQEIFNIPVIFKIINIPCI